MATGDSNQVTNRLPKLRDDLQITRQQTPEGTVYVVRDPHSGRFCRFGEAEHFIAQQCDGQSSLEEIRQRAETEFDAPVPAEVLEQFLNKLRELHLLQPQDGEVRPGSQPAGRVQGSTLHLRVKLFDPDRLLERLVGPLGFAFTGGFLMLSTGLILLASWVALENGTEMRAAAAQLLKPQMLLPGIGVMFATIFVHEFAHGLTCKRFGGPVHEIGFLLIYFLPAFYCDVTSAWGFAEKRQRLWVTFAGAWCDLVMWGAAVLGWRITQPETWVNTLCLLVAAATGLRSVFNLNPLIKLDGYYLLSDWLEIPNLRQRAFAYLGSRLSGSRNDEDSGREASARQRRVFVMYGSLAAVYSALLLTFVGSKAGGFLMGRFQAIGFLAFLGGLALILRRPLGKLPSLALRLCWPAAMVTSRTQRLPMPAWPLKLLVPVSALVAVLFLCEWELSVVGDVEVNAAEKAQIRAEVDGQISDVFVEEGEAVSQDALIVRLASRDRLAELEQVEAQIQQQSANLKLLQAGPKPEQIELADAEVQTAKTRCEHAQKRLSEARAMHAARLLKTNAAVREAESNLRLATAQMDRHTVLMEREAITLAQLQQAEAECETFRAELDAARAEERLVRADDLAEPAEAVAVAKRQFIEAEQRLRLLESGARTEEIEAARAELDRLESRRRHLQHLIEQTVVTTPIAGVVTTPRIREQKHVDLSRGDLIATVQRLDTVRVELSVSEKDMDEVQLGRPVDLRVLADPNRTFHGEVTSVAPAADPSEPDQKTRRFIVTTHIDNESLFLRPGMTGKAKIRCGQRRIGDLVLRKLSHYVRVEFWSWW